MNNLDLLLADVKQASPERVKAHLLELIEHTDESKIIPSTDNGYIDNDDNIPIFTFYINNFNVTSFTKK